MLELSDIFSQGQRGFRVFLALGFVVSFGFGSGFFAFGFCFFDALDMGHIAQTKHAIHGDIGNQAARGRTGIGQYDYAKFVFGQHRNVRREAVNPAAMSQDMMTTINVHSPAHRVAHIRGFIIVQIATRDDLRRLRLQ